MTQFNKAAQEHFEKLELYTTAITRAHGKNHPEAFEVRDLFSEIHAKTQQAGSTKPELDAEFARLRDVTDNYTIPTDVCETYAAVYTMLAEVDAAYQV